MSSAVNKSSTRFMPKATGRGVGRGTPRRMSTIRASFSIPPPEKDDDNAADTSNTPTRPIIETPKEVLESGIPESAIDDHDFVPPPTDIRPKRGRASTTSRSASFSAKQATTVEPQAPSVLVSRSSMLDAGEKAHKALPDPAIVKPLLANSIPQPVEPITPGLAPKRTSMRLAKISDPPAWKTAKKPRASVYKSASDIFKPSSASATPILTPRRATVPEESQSEVPVVPEVTEPVVRKRQFDEQGREILDPEDLPKMVRGRAYPSKDYEDKVINVDKFTMATLCQDIPIGVPNENYHEYEDARISRKRKRARILRAKQMIRGIYQPKNVAIRAELLQVYEEYQNERRERFGLDKDQAKAFENVISGESSQQHQVMQLRRDEFGEIILDAESQTLDRHANANNRADEEGKRDTTEIDTFSTVINSYSFSNKERPERWTADETEQFYKALSVWGTDFNLIAEMFPNRTRHQIKTKFKYEERRNEEKVQLYLVHRRSVNVGDYAKISGKTIIEVADMNRDLEKIRKDHEEQLKFEETEKQRARDEDLGRQQELEKKRSGKRVIDVVKPERK